MKTLTFNGWVDVNVCERWNADSTTAIDGFVYNFYGFKVGQAYKATMTVELPDNFDPRPDAVKELEAKRTKLQGEFQMALNEINNQISKLQAISYEASGESA